MSFIRQSTLMEPTFSTEINYIDFTPPTTTTQGTSTTSDDDLKHYPSRACSTKSNIIEPVISEFKEFSHKYFQKIISNQDVYEGYVVAENLHGQGFYLTHRNGEKYFYDAQFYMNKLEGYGQIFYENATHFQGLFKEQWRFGPGVLTYPDGTQDVGFWQGLKLIRLAVGTDIVPSLVSTHVGKSKILCSRCMVPLCDEDNILPNETISKYADEIFNIHIRNPRSFFFHRSFYDEQFFEGQDCLIRVHIDEEEVPEKIPTTQSISKKIDVAIVERTEKLKSKIKEVKEFVEVYEDIKENLQRKIDVCNECCKSVPEDQIHEESVETVTIQTDVESIDKPHFLDGSVDSSMFTSGINTDKETVISGEEIESFTNYSTQMTPSVQEHISSNICTCDEEEEIEDIQKLEDQLKNVTDQYLFYKNIQVELQKKLDKLNIANIEEDIIKYKLVKVNDLWAWNNEASVIQMQKHCFKHRNSEDMVNFSVKNLVLGNRKEFGSAGKHEQMCYKFLVACSKGNIDFVRNCLRTNKVHANIADAKGNSAIFYAAVRGKLDIMKTLTNYGAKLDQLNDEQLTPLSMCLLKFIAIKNNIDDWERAFFQERRQCDLPDLPKWYNIRSFLSLKSMTSLKSSIDPENATVQSTSTYEKNSLLQQKKGRRASSMVQDSYIFNLDCTIHDTQYCLKDDSQKNVRNDYATIIALLDHRANPNCCEVPYPALVLAMFTESPDMVRELIKAGVNINVTIEDNLSCLHIVSSLPLCKTNVHICMALLKYGCNPNIKTLSSHWADRAQIYKGNIPEQFEIEDCGKNALHILCMRTDFELDVNNCIYATAKLLLDTELDTNEIYLGHTALSLAVITGNIELAILLATSYKFDPYEPLFYGMGNILTLYALKRFEHVLPLDQCKAMLSALCDAGVNLLQKVDDSENAITFVEEADTFFDQFIEKDVKKGVKPKKLEKASPIKEFMRILARQAIIKQIQMYTTEIFYEFLEEGTLEEYEITKILATEYLTPLIAIQNLKDLFENRPTEHDRINLERVKALLDFVNLHKKVAKQVARKLPKNKNPDIKKDKISLEVKPSDENLDILVQKFGITINLHHMPHPFLIAPGLDNPKNYNVCYHCLRGRDKILISCPRCQVIKFCSVQCNKLNVKLKTQHGCNLVFYDMTPEQISDITQGVCLDEIVKKGRENLLKHITERRAAKLREEEQKLLDMWRADTYGTKFLQLKPLLKKVGLNLRGESNWTVETVKHLMEKNFRKYPGDTSLYCLENLLMKLQIKQKSQTTIRTKQSWSTRRSTLGGSTLPSAIFEIYDDTSKEKNDDTIKICRCSTKCIHQLPKTTKTSKRVKKEPTKKFTSEEIHLQASQQYKTQIPQPLEQLTVQDKSTMIVKKLPRIPTRYQRFIEVIAQHFPEIDFSNWLLPYACYSDGQLYYKFCGDIFKESYSLS